MRSASGEPRAATHSATFPAVTRRRRGILVAVGLLVLTAGCSSATSSADRHTVPTSTTPTETYHGSAYQWLLNVAEPWNHKLNEDQIGIDQASSDASGVQSSTYFGKLTASCRALLADARQAGDIVSAPTEPLREAWHLMVQQTDTYASTCLVVARRPTQSNLDQWNNALSQMDGANQLFNEQVSAARSAATTTSTKPTAAATATAG